MINNSTIFCKNLTTRIWENGVQKFLGAWHFSSLTPSGDRTPHMIGDYYTPGDPDKNIF